MRCDVKTYNMVVFTNPVAGREKEFNDWYDSQHLQDVINIPGFVSAQRFRAVDALGGELPRHQYYALYTLCTDDVEGSIVELMKRSGTAQMPLSEAMGPDVSFAIYEAITDVVKQ